jgi:prevent-host-death family protein
MQEVNIHEAKTRLSQLLEQVAAGEEIVIARYGKPVARLTPYTQSGQARRGGRDAGTFSVPDCFDDELPELNRRFQQ